MNGPTAPSDEAAGASASADGVLARLARAEGLLARLEARFVQLLMMLLLVVGVLQVAIRMAGQRSAGTDEITTMTMITLIFVGCGIITYTAEYIAIEVLDFVRHEVARTVFRLAGMLATGVFAVIFGYYSWDLMSRIGWQEKTLQLGLPIAATAAVMVVGAALMLLHTVGNALRVVFGEDRYRDSRRAALLTDEGAVA
ncbi:TRAP transporter small permease [Aeromicrobium sp. CTD01-1L150]|uniref:TRAP transporter small permease n=1 Tax=Aeromicrobium sp. CTD01-1L150 TaxID=3341830 RepID=UPI0035C17053